MNKEDRYFTGEENISDMLSRFKSSMVSGRKDYFDVSEFEKLVEYFLDEGDISSSEIAARQGIQIHPGAVQLHLKYAQVLLNKGQYDKALEYIELAENIESGNPDIQILKGSAWLVLGEDVKAERAFSSALDAAGSDMEEILCNIGSAYVEAGETGRAMQYFERALLINPENEMALYELGFFNDQQGDFEKSTEYYNRYLDNDPFNYSVWFNLGISYNKAGKFEKAIEAYEFAGVLNEDFTQVIFNIGNAYANMGKFNQAIIKYKEFLKFNPKNDDAWCYIGECYLNMEDYSNSEYHYHKAVELNKENDTAWFGVGLIMWVEQKLDESVVFIKKALKIDNSNSEYWLTLAKVYNDKNKPVQAERALVKASGLDPDNSEIWLLWIDLCLQMDKPDKAMRIMKSALKANDDVLLKYRMVSLLLESKQEKDAFEMLHQAMKQEFIQISYLFDIYPKALKNKRINKLVKEFRQNNII